MCISIANKTQVKNLTILEAFCIGLFFEQIALSMYSLCEIKNTIQRLIAFIKQVALWASHEKWKAVFW